MLREIPLQPQPDVHVVGEVEPGRHDAGDRILAVVHFEQPADDRGVGVEALAPEAIADDRDLLARVERSALREAGPELRRHAENLEQVGAGLDGADAHRIRSGAIETGLGTPPRGRVGEDPVEGAVIHEVHGRQPFLRQRLLGVGLPDGDEPIGLPIGERLEQDGVDDAEDRGRGAGAEAQRGNRQRGERRRAAKLAPGEPEIAAQAGPSAPGRADVRARFGGARSRGRHDRQRRFGQGRFCGAARVGVAAPGAAGVEVDVFEMRRKLVHRVLRQRGGAGPARLLDDEGLPVGTRSHG